MSYSILKIIGRFLALFIKLLSLLPFDIVKVKIIKKLNILKNRISPALFDSETTLKYVQKKKLGLESNFGTIKTLALRGSTADYGFYSSLWENSYNLGLISSSLYTNYHLYNNYRNQLSNLQNVIIFSSVCSPGYSLIRTSERYRVVAYKYFFDVPYEKKEFINPYFEKQILKKCKSLPPQELDINYMGFEKKTYYGTDITAEDRTQSHLRENKREPDQLNWLKNLRDLVNEDGRKLFIVIPPYRTDYKKLLPTDSTLFSKFYNLDGVEILNYYNSEIFVDSDFGDTDHLNENGSIKLTNDIKQVFKNKKWF